VETERLALPALFSAALPSAVAPEKNCTKPVGVPVVDVTVAVIVTVCPTVDGFGVEVKAVVVVVAVEELTT
jgi:hypothetical protein